MALRRARGVLLRLVRRRPLAISVGAAMVTPAVWLEASGQGGVWWFDALSLLVGATGAALIWAGVSGTKPDWVEDDV